jgi:hypothetical protein
MGHCYEKDLYVYLLSDKTNEEVTLPASITLNKVLLNKKSKIVLLDSPKEK